MLKIINKYYAISPKNDPHGVVGASGRVHSVHNSEHYYYTLDKAKEAFLQLTGEPYTDMNKPSQYNIIEIKLTLETDRI